MKRGKSVCMLCGEINLLDKHHIDYEDNITLMVCKRCHTILDKLPNRKRETLKYPVDITCRRCNYSWKFKGKNPYMATCPHCLLKTPVPIEKIDIEKEKGEKYDK